MSVNSTWVGAPPDAVFDVLADPYSYEAWVPEPSRTADADEDWPEPGSEFHHVHGPLGIGLHDTTAVVSATRPRTILLEARLRPLIVSKVEFRLFPRRGGTRVVLVEHATGGLARLVPAPLLDPALWLRNAEALRRIRRLAERRAG